MSTQTPLIVPVIPDPQALYNSIMREIEPDLLTDVIPTLSKKYEKETTEQRKARADRYNQAFKKYDQKYTDYMLKLDSRVREFKKAAYSMADAASREQDAKRLETLEFSFTADDQIQK